MMPTIVQQQSGHVSSFTLAQQPDDANFLTLFVWLSSGVHPNGVASQWVLISNSTTGAPQEWRGKGPFSGTVVGVMPGRTPPQVDAMILEIAQ